MMYSKMQPRSGSGPLHVLVIGRVSTPGQQQSNIEAGYEYAERILPDIDDGTAIVKRLGEQASGMLVNRKTMTEAENLVKNRWPDVVLMEDVSKCNRNPRWIYTFVQDCVDRDVRVIAPGDSFDTSDENWEAALAAAAMRHGMHIPDTRRRIRRTSSKSFAEGGMVLRIRAGYRRLTKEDAASGQFGPKGLRMAKLPDWTEIFRRLRELVLEDGFGGARLADWLNNQEPPIPPPPYCKKPKWTDKVVLLLLRDPILYGLRQFPKVRHDPRFSDGGHRRKKNPSPARKFYPELAHMTEPEWTEMVKKLDEIGARARRPTGLQSPRHQVPRTKTVSLLQHLRCSVCGGIYYFSGKDGIKCCNAITHEAGACWNRVQVPCPIARQRLVDLLLKVMDRHPLAREAFLDAAWSQIEQTRRRGQRDITDFDKEITLLNEQAERLTDAIASGGKLDSLVKRLKTIDAARKVAVKNREDARKASADANPVDCREYLSIDPRTTLLDLAHTSFEFGDLLRKIIPRFILLPVQALDSAQVHPRALLTLDLSRLVPANHGPLACEPEDFELDLFEAPVHIKHLPQILATKEARLQRGAKASLSLLAAEIGVNRMTVKRALAYHRLMLVEGVDVPFRVLTSPPQEASRWKPRKKKPIAPIVAIAKESTLCV